MKQPMTALIGHRGLPLLAPENTRTSFEIAAAHGIEWIEVDVTMAGDDSLVIMHDTHLKLFGLPELQLINMDEAQLRTIDAGRWFNEANAGEPLLFLHELLVLIQSLELGMNLEIKAHPDIDTQHQVDSVLQRVQQYNFPLDRLIISSFDLNALTFVRAASDEIQIGVLFDTLPEDWLTQAKPLKPTSIHCNHTVLTEELTQQISQHYPVYCYTVNDTERFKTLLSWGVAGIFCDRAHAQDLRDCLKV